MASCNYIITYDGVSQVYSAASEATALKALPPKECTIEEKRVYFITYEPDDGKIVVYEVDKEKVIEEGKVAVLADEAKKAEKKRLKEQEEEDES